MSTVAPTVREASVYCAWRVSRALSVRASVRVDRRRVHKYDAVLPLDQAEAPEQPWALHLTDAGGLFRLVGLDFDDKDASGLALNDSAECVGWLRDAGIAHLVCASGGNAGRHVWIRLDGEGICVDEMRAMATVLKNRWKTLDLSPLSNEFHSLLRPPGSPHRHGGRSEPLSDVDAWLSQPLVSPSSWRTAVAASVNDWNDVDVDQDNATARVLPRDDDGHPFLPGPRRPLTSLVRGLADAPLDHSDDASSRTWSVLLGAAAAHWHLGDVVDELLDSPALTHIRTARLGPVRVPRAPDASNALLARQWAKAVAQATLRPSRGDDEGFGRRAGMIASWVADLQARADVCVGRWTRGGGPADRRVLDALCRLALEAVAATVSADIRRLAKDTGLGSSTVHRALQRLSDTARGEDWISLAAPSMGTLAATWKIDPNATIHTDFETGGTQVNPPPLWDTPTPAANRIGTGLRTAWLTRLRTRCAHLRHDVFTHRRVGTLAGNVYSRIPELVGLASLREQFDHDLVDGLRPLEAYGLIYHVDGTVHHSDPSTLQRAAQQLDVVDALKNRALRYDAERVRFSFWLQELDWLRRPRRDKGGRDHLNVEQPFLVPPTPAALTKYRYPRNVDGTPAHDVALQVLAGRPARHRPRVAVSSADTLRQQFGELDEL